MTPSTSTSMGSSIPNSEKAASISELSSRHRDRVPVGHDLEALARRLVLQRALLVDAAVLAGGEGHVAEVGHGLVLDGLEPVHDGVGGEVASGLLQADDQQAGHVAALPEHRFSCSLVVVATVVDAGV